MSCHAQNRITGKVIGDNGHPVSMANVMLYPDSLGKQSMKAFSITNKDGAFTLNASENNDGWLRVKCLGYEDKVEKLSSSTQPCLIRIFPKVYQIEEITVKSNYTGVRAREDSIIFDVNHFKTGAEESVSDVLRRLPGMEVSETGKVRYEGRNVSKVLVNGDDIMSTGSGMMLNGLSADVIQGAEILKDWSDGSIAGTLKNGEGQMALNIKTSDKLKLTGKLEAGGGLLNKYQANGTSMSIGKHGSLTMAAASNNQGRAILSLEDYISNFVDLQGLASGGVNQMELSEEESAMLTPPTNVYDNTASGFILNGCFTPSKQLDIKIGVLLNKNRMYALDQNSTVYFDSEFSSNDIDSTENINNSSSANMHIRWQPSNSFEVSSSTFCKWAKYTTLQSISYLGNGPMTLSQQEKVRNTDVKQSLQIAKRLDKATIYALMTFNRQSQHDGLDVCNDSLLLPSYKIISPDHYGILSNHSDIHTLTGVELGGKWSIAKGYLLGVALSHNRTKDELRLEDRYWHDHNTNSLYRKSGATLMFEKNKGFLQVRGGFAFVHNNYSLAEIKRTSADINFNAQIRLVFTPKNELILVGNRETSHININRMLDFPMHLSYNRIQQTSRVTAPLVTNNVFSAHYRLLNNYSNLIMFLSAIYSRKDGAGLRNVNQHGITSDITFMDGGKEEWFSFHSVISKGLGNAPADIRLKLSWQNSSVAAALNNGLYTVKMRIPKIEANLVTRMKSFFNCDLGTSYERNMFTGYADRKTHNDLWEAHLHAFFVFGNFKGTLKYDLARTNGNDIVRTSHNIGFLMSYKLKRLKLSLSGDNLLYLRDNEWLAVNNSSYSSATTHYRRMPGYISLSCSWNL